MVPFYHRKVWEMAFVAQAIWEAGLLAPGRRALGFAVGRKPCPASWPRAGWRCWPPTSTPPTPAPPAGSAPASTPRRPPCPSAPWT
ncbi:hypothetical protein ACFQU7_18870 [Pseudoroseomonas wenyumeiae]